MKIFIFATALALSSSCATKTKSSEPKRVDGMCSYDDDPVVAKVTNYEGMPDSIVSAYAQSCIDQVGVWKAETTFAPPSGTNGCLLAPSGGGPAVTTWYTGTTYPTTPIDCGDLTAVTK